MSCCVVRVGQRAYRGLRAGGRLPGQQPRIRWPAYAYVASIPITALPETYARCLLR